MMFFYSLSLFITVFSLCMLRRPLKKSHKKAVCFFKHNGFVDFTQTKNRCIVRFHLDEMKAGRHNATINPHGDLRLGCQLSDSSFALGDINVQKNNWCTDSIVVNADINDMIGRSLVISNEDDKICSVIGISNQSA